MHCCATEAAPGAGASAWSRLFFDLVFVFAVTQLSHTLLAQLTLDNLAQVTLLFLAVWWCGCTRPG